MFNFFMLGSLHFLDLDMNDVRVVRRLTLENSPKIRRELPSLRGTRVTHRSNKLHPLRILTFYSLSYVQKRGGTCVV